MKSHNIFSILSILIFTNVTFFAQSNSDSLKYELNQITVTATRSPEMILEVPFAVSFLNYKNLSYYESFGFDKALSKVPGVLAQTRTGSQDIRIVIRGFGARGAGDRSNSGTSRGIRIMIDGIPETEPDGRTSFDNIDLDFTQKIEIVRSNASAIWGNASGGIINFSYNKEFDNPFLELKSSFGSFGLKEYSLNSGTVLGNGKIQLDITNTKFDGWREHSSTERTLIHLGLQSNFDKKTVLNFTMLGANSLFNIPGPLTETQFYSDASKANSIYKMRDERRHNKLVKFGISLTHNFDNSNSLGTMLFVNPKYLQRSERGTYRDFTRYHLGGNLIYKNNLQLSKNIKNMFSIGLDEAYQDGAVLFYSLSDENKRGDKLKADKREGANNFGAFIQDEINLGNNLSIIFGGRYDNITYYSEDFLVPSLGLQKKSFVRFTPKIAITYMFNNFHSIYANLGGGIEVPAGNETDPASTFGQDSVYLLSPLLEPIESTTLEIGTKNIFYFGSNYFINYFTYETSLYHIKIKNDIIPYRGGRFYFTAGESHRTGLELNTNLNFNMGLSIQAALTYSLNKYDKYLVDSVHYQKPGKFADYSGNKAAGIPDLFFNISTTYESKLLGGLFLNLNVKFVNNYYVNDANTLEVPSYHTFNLTLGLSKRIRISKYFSVNGFLAGNNIFNKLYASSAFINPGYINGKAVYLEAGLPRNYVASIKLFID